MQKCMTALTLVAVAAAPAPARAEDFRPGERVEAAAAFFMCGARDDLATLQTLERQGDRQTALKIGMERCESGRPGTRYIVMQADAGAVCIRRENAPYCLWARSASLQVTPTQ